MARTPYLDRSTVNAWLRAYVQRDSNLRRIVDGRSTPSELLAVYAELGDAVEREFSAPHFGLDGDDLQKVVLDLLDPNHNRWPEHPLVHHRSWPTFNPELFEL